MFSLIFSDIEEYESSEDDRKLLTLICGALEPPAGLLVSSQLIVSCVCVSVPFAFVVLKEGLDLDPPAILQELRELIATKIAKYAVPEHFLVSPCPPDTHPTHSLHTVQSCLCFISLVSVCQVVKRLPKTRSGKIMRRILKKIAMGMSDNLGDVSTLDDPSVVTEIIQAHEQYREQLGDEKKKTLH